MTENKLFDDGTANPIPGLVLRINDTDITDSVSTVEMEYCGQSPIVSIINSKIRKDSVEWSINGDPNGLIADCVNAGTYVISATVTRDGYDPTTLSGTLVITKRILTVTGTTVSNKAYDGTTAATIFRGYLSGAVDSASTAWFASGSFPDSAVGDYSVPISYTVYTGATDTAVNYILPEPIEIRASIFPKTVTAPGTTASDKVFDGSDEASVSIGELVGVLAGEDVSATATGHFENSEPGENKKVVVDYTLTGDDAGNYSMESDEIQASITPDPDSRTVSWSGIKYRSRKIS